MNKFKHGSWMSTPCLIPLHTDTFQLVPHLFSCTVDSKVLANGIGEALSAA